MMAHRTFRRRLASARTAWLWCFAYNSIKTSAESRAFYDRKRAAGKPDSLHGASGDHIDVAF
jgi:hypothetical protein